MIGGKPLALGATVYARWGVYAMSGIATFVAVSAVAPAAAQCLLCETQTVSTPPPTPLRVEIDAGLDFDRVALTASTGGQVRVDPVARNRSVAGALSDLGGLFMAGSVTVRGEPGRTVAVTLPGSVALRTPGGSTANVTRLVTDLPPAPRLDRDGSLRFSFGGQLDVSGEAGGDYRGRIAITVDYQ